MLDGILQNLAKDSKDLGNLSQQAEEQTLSRMRSGLQIK